MLVINRTLIKTFDDPQVPKKHLSLI